VPHFFRDAVLGRFEPAAHVRKCYCNRSCGRPIASFRHEALFFPLLISGRSKPAVQSSHSPCHRRLRQSSNGSFVKLGRCKLLWLAAQRSYLRTGLEVVGPVRSTKCTELPGLAQHVIRFQYEQTFNKCRFPHLAFITINATAMIIKEPTKYCFLLSISTFSTTGFWTIKAHSYLRKRTAMIVFREPM
jgi:hypothetical protein